MPKPSSGSVTHWVRQLERADAEAARQLWQRYQGHLTQLAANALGKGPRAVADEEDVVLETFDFLFRRAREQGMSQVADRHDFWRLLVTIAHRQAVNQVRWARRQKRGGARSSAEGDRIPRERALIERESADPMSNPELAAATAESVNALLGLLDSDERRIALLKLEGYSNAEIAARIGRAVPTVERRLRLIRTRWHDWGSMHARRAG